MAIGYEPLEEGKPFPLNGPLAEAQWLEVDIAAGSIASTPADMSKYIRMLLNRGALPKKVLHSSPKRQSIHLIVANQRRMVTECGLATLKVTHVCVTRVEWLLSARRLMLT